MNQSRRVGLRTLFVIFSALMLLVFYAASAADGLVDCKSGPIVVKIHADWCGSCKASKATWDRVEKELANRATVVEFDVSDRVSYQQSLLDAERMGVEAFFQEYRSQTGTVAILACETRRPVVILQGERDFDKYLRAVEKASST